MTGNTRSRRCSREVSRSARARRAAGPLLLNGAVEPSEELGPEDGREGADGEEVARVGGDPPRALRGEGTSRHEAMQVNGLD